MTRDSPSAQVAAAATTPAADLPARNEDTTVVVVGPTGYIGRFVTKELIRRGYKVSSVRERMCKTCSAAYSFLCTHHSQVVAFSRERSGVGGKKGKEDVISDFQGAHKVVFGDVQVRGHLCILDIVPPSDSSAVGVFGDQGYGEPAEHRLCR